MLKTLSIVILGISVILLFPTNQNTPTTVSLNAITGEESYGYVRLSDLRHYDEQPDDRFFLARDVKLLRKPFNNFAFAVNKEDGKLTIHVENLSQISGVKDANRGWKLPDDSGEYHEVQIGVKGWGSYPLH